MTGPRAPQGCQLDEEGALGAIEGSQCVEVALLRGVALRGQRLVGAAASAEGRGVGRVLTEPHQRLIDQPDRAQVRRDEGKPPVVIDAVRQGQEVVAADGTNLP